MPTRIITDFELTPINTSHHKFPNAVQKGCYFYLCQSRWCKIQENGLATQYGNDIQFSLMICYLFALAFLSAQEIPATFKIPKSCDGTVATHGLPLFQPSLWSIYDSIELGVPRTQNVVEAWHHYWKTLVGGLN
ncbi:3888_t:CDS:2, partial [Cetraspora pellucida]